MYLEFQFDGTFYLSRQAVDVRKAEKINQEEGNGTTVT